MYLALAFVLKKLYWVASIWRKMTSGRLRVARIPQFLFYKIITVTDIPRVDGISVNLR